MSAEVTPVGIRVNCIHPGLIDTPMTSWVMNDPVVLPQILTRISLGRAGAPRDRHRRGFPSVDDASYLTGQSIFVDGGWQGK